MSTLVDESPVDQGFVLIEDHAMRQKISGLKVTDDNAAPGGRPVPAYFRFPQTEAQAQRFPYLTVDLLAVNRAEDREHRGYTRIPYFPADDSRDLANPLPDSVDDNTDLMGDYPVPVNLDYQVISWSRHLRHDRSILGQLLAIDRLPIRFGYLEVGSDGTVRSLDLLSGPAPDDLIDPAGKRLFRKVWNVRVYSELLPAQIEHFMKVSSVIVNMSTVWSPVEPVSEPELRSAAIDVSLFGA